MCLQETKLVDEKFPRETLAEAGYDAVFAGQPTYNGVAILTRRESVGAPSDVIVGNPHHPDPQQRLIAATVGGIRIVDAYFPNGQSVDSDKYRYKLGWIDALNRWLGELITDGPPLVLAGDFNIAPEPRDVHDPAAWEGQVLFSMPERERFGALVALGLVDSFRLFEQAPKAYSWWDYRQLAFQRNQGLRIDHLLVDRRLAERVRGCTIDRAARKVVQPSDHAPVTVEIAAA